MTTSMRERPEDEPRWRVVATHTGLFLISPRGVVATIYGTHQRRQAEMDAARLNARSVEREQ